MVLAELGSQIQDTLRKLQSTTVVDEEVLNQILKDISRALLQADVNIKVVGELRKKVKDGVKLDDIPAGVNRQKLIRKVIIDQLVEMVGGSKEPYRLKKGKSNVVMFVGLQGSGKTTTIAKYANYYARKGWKCAMVSVRAHALCFFLTVSLMSDICSDCNLLSHVDLRRYISRRGL